MASVVVVVVVFRPADQPWQARVASQAYQYCVAGRGEGRGNVQASMSWRCWRAWPQVFIFSIADSGVTVRQPEPIQGLACMPVQHVRRMPVEALRCMPS
eukprot:354682-Chlamydomonas_euryale.AAC.4